MRILCTSSVLFPITYEVQRIQDFISPYFPCTIDFWARPNATYDYTINYVPYATWKFTDRLAYAENKNAYIALSMGTDHVYIQGKDMGTTVFYYGVHEICHLLWQEIGAHYQYVQTSTAGKEDTVHYFCDRGDLLGAVKDVKLETDIFKLQNAVPFLPATIAATIMAFINKFRASGN